MKVAEGVPKALAGLGGDNVLLRHALVSQKRLDAYLHTPLRRIPKAAPNPALLALFEQYAIVWQAQYEETCLANGFGGGFFLGR